jgi:uncharacterized protein YprB with RNaseH-like and TPR domain
MQVVTGKKGGQLKVNLLSKRYLGEKIGFFDIESSNLQATFGIVLTYCIKALGGKIIKRSIKPSEIRKKIYDKNLMKQFIKDVRQFDRIVGYYSTRFDVPFLRTRCLFYKLDFPLYKEVLHTDVYYMVRNKLRLHRNRLETACEFFHIPAKEHRLKGDIWIAALGGDKKSLDFILKHNMEDVISLEALWKKLDLFTMKTRRSI